MAGGLVIVGLLAGCLAPPDLPLLERIPLEARPEGLCRAPEPGVAVGCVLDGDTLDVGGCGDGARERVRLLGVQAPERAREAPAECHAEASYRALADLLAHRVVALTFDRRCTDPYGRTLAYVWLDAASGGAELVNAWLLREGLARRFGGPLEEGLLLGPRLDAAEDLARRAERGLWRHCRDDEG